MNTPQTPTAEPLAPLTGSALGAVRKNGFDKDGYERRSQLVAITDCPRCKKTVELWDDTTEWVKDSRGRWKHNQYSGCGTGDCCGLLFADDWDGCRVFELHAPNTKVSDRPADQPNNPQR